MIRHENERKRKRYKSGQVMVFSLKPSYLWKAGAGKPAPFLSHDGNQSSRGTLTKLSFWAISMMSAGESSYVVISTM